MKHPSDYQQALGQAIKDRRTGKGLSPAKLARVIGENVDRINAIENGEIDPGLSDMILIARALGLPLSTLLAVAESILPRT